MQGVWRELGEHPMTSVHSHLEDISHRGWMPVWLSKLTESALAAQVLAAFEKFAPMFRDYIFEQLVDVLVVEIT